MEITPNELRDIEISRAVRGYDTHEVHELLDRAAASVVASGDGAGATGAAIALPSSLTRAWRASIVSAARSSNSWTSWVS
jgi:DivIVA domain-containing protein